MMRHSHIEIEITTACDQRCPCCDRFADVAPGEPMTLGQIEQFVQESLALDWQWERIHVLGGEPTLHDDFRAIVEALMRYRSLFPDCLLRVITNGRGRLSAHADWLRDNRIHIATVYKARDKMPAYWDNMWIAPKDVAPELCPLPACGIYGYHGCGIGFTRYGFFLCGAGASIARVAGLDIGIQALAELTHERCLCQAERLCELCNHAVGFHNKYVETGPRKSPFWERTIAAYQRAVPPMTPYAESSLKLVGAP